MRLCIANTNDMPCVLLVLSDPGQPVDLVLQYYVTLLHVHIRMMHAYHVIVQFTTGNNLQVDSEQRAREVCTHRVAAIQDRRQQQVAAIFTAEEEEDGEGEEGENRVVPLIIKGDVAGSVEAVVDVIKSRHPEKFELKVILSGVGAVSESDIEMAAAAKGGLGQGKSLYCRSKTPI